jgi:integrase/recombinase XerD
VSAVFEEYLADYLRLRRIMGHRLARHEELIRAFLVEHEGAGGTSVTTGAALTFATRPQGTSARWHASRLNVVRDFARYVHAQDPALAELIPPGLIRARVTRGVPYIYSPSQISELMATARSLIGGLRGETLRCVIGLMATTGLRVSECVALDNADVDLVEGVLRVTGKRANLRLVPLHPTTTEALRRYRHTTLTLAGSDKTDAFFRTTLATRPHPSALQQGFRRVSTHLGYSARPGGSLPRLHDLRHAFATSTLVRAHREGRDVEREVALLATYLGHVSPVSTYWYLTAVPELLELAAKRVAVMAPGRLLP